jgi:hypothetical protein
MAIASWDDGETKYDHQICRNEERGVAAFMSPSEGFDRADVAGLPRCEVAELSHEELLQVIAAARIPFVAANSLRFQERGTLERLAHLSRRTCRNRLQAGSPDPWDAGVAELSRSAAGPA